MADPQLPLSYQASATSTDPTISSTLPSEVVTCLNNARFLHLATCDSLYPHVSLMNYTYLPTSPYSTHPTIIMTTNPASKKTLNLIANPRVSLLVHDWVSHRPPTATSTVDRGDARSPSPPRARQSSLANLLLNLNTSALSSISATINGVARLVDRGTEEERYYKARHVENNTFEGQPEEGSYREEDGGRGCFIEGDEVRVVVVRVQEGRIADWKGGVRDWRVIGAEEVDGGEGLVNGVHGD